LEPQVFDKSDLDYYFLERLEKMRDCGVKEDDYNLIEQEEKFSLERADNSFDEDQGYLSDYEGQYENENDISQHSEKKIKQIEEDKHAEDIPNSIRLFAETSNSSVLTIELKSLLKDCKDMSRASEMSSELCLSK
jgi:hypothetical protein